MLGARMGDAARLELAVRIAPPQGQGILVGTLGRVGRASGRADASQRGQCAD
jgi:hypothetical protein